MGSFTPGKIKCFRLAAPGGPHIFLWNRDRADHRKLGAETSVPLHHGSRVPRPDLILGHLAGGSCQFPSSSHRTTSCRSAHALSSRNLGIGARLRPRFDCRRSHCLFLAGKRNQRAHIFRSPHACLPVAERPPPSALTRNSDRQLVVTISV